MNLEQVTEIAKHTMRIQGKHLPQLLVEYADNKILPVTIVSKNSVELIIRKYLKEAVSGKKICKEVILVSEFTSSKTYPFTRLLGIVMYRPLGTVSKLFVFRNNEFFCVGKCLQLECLNPWKNLVGKS